MSPKYVYSFILDLMESSSKDDKKNVFLSFLNERKKKTDLVSICGISSRREHKKIYYKKDLISKFKRLSKKDKVIINNLFLMVLKKKETVLSISDKVVLKEIFQIKKRKDMNKIIDYYFYCHDFLNLDLEMVDFDLSSFGDYYLPITISYNKRKELEDKGITRINQIKRGMISILDLYLIDKYVLEINRYVINDKIIYSILEKEYRDIVRIYFMYHSFLKASVVMNKSLTSTRVMFYTAVKAFVEYLESPNGGTFLRLLFSRFGFVIGKNDIKKIFSEFSDFIIYIFKEELIKNIKYDAKSDSFIAL